jgi:uncharacterized protein YecA (UPF0149 family)
MGAIAEAIVAYAQPLFDETDGSIDKMNRVMTVAQMCWNLALLPEGQREKAIDELRPALNMTDEEFAEFRQHVVLPMIQRHHEMFPGMHSRLKQPLGMVDVMSPPAKKYPSTKNYSGTDRYAPCPCGSGRKYKFCCGASK